MNVVREINKINDIELSKKLTESGSWHDQYRNSPYIFVGGLPYAATEGDVITVFSQYGEIIDLNLIRDRDTGKSKGFAYIGYENQKSTVLAVDNLNGIEIASRTIRVDHCQNYRDPKIKEGEESEEQRKQELERHINALPKHLRPEGMNEESADEESDKETKKDKKNKKIVKLEQQIAEIDPEDPMLSLLQDKLKRKKMKLAEKALEKAEKKKSKKSSKKSKKDHS